MSAIVVFGSGSYVLGDAFGPQPVLRGILQWARRHDGPPVKLVCRSPEKRPAIQAQVDAIVAEMGGAVELVTPEQGFAALPQALAAFVCVPDDAHASHVERAVAANCPVWVVKPLTGDLDQAKALVAQGGTVWVDYHKRFDDSNAFLRKAIADRRHGEALHYAVQYTQPRALPLDGFAWAGGTDVFTYIGCHYVDQLDFLFPGLAVEKVSAIGLDGDVHAKLGGRAHDVVVAQIAARQASGKRLLATLQVGWCDPAGTPGKSHQRVEMTFTDGRIIADQKARGLQVWDSAKTWEVNPYFFTARLNPVDNRLEYAGYGIDSIERFLDWCRNPSKELRASPTLPWMERSLFTEAVLDMVRHSLDRDGAWISP